MTAIYEITISPAIGKVATGNNPAAALSVFQTYVKLAKSGQIVELRRNGSLVKTTENFHAA